jgi:hypothetical protein
MPDLRFSARRNRDPIIMLGSGGASQSDAPPKERQPIAPIPILHNRAYNSAKQIYLALSRVFMHVRAKYASR